MRLCVDTESFSRTASGDLVGAVWIEFAGGAFPSAGWSDFVLRVFEQWASEYAQIWSGNGVARFMVFDGSDRMRLERRNDEVVVSIEAADGGAVEKRLRAEEIAELGESAVLCSHAVLDSCRVPLTDEEVTRFQGVAAIFQPGVW